jgi:hypothetical protein
MKKIHFPYRFKTKQEFIDEYGEDFRHICNWCTDGGMDYLYGKPYPFIKVNVNIKLISIDGWYISIDMLTLNEEKIPDYKPKKLIYD